MRPVFLYFVQSFGMSMCYRVIGCGTLVFVPGYALTASCICLVQLKELVREYEATAEGQPVKLRELLEKERAVQSAATQLAAKRSQLLTNGQSAEVRVILFGSSLCSFDPRPASLSVVGVILCSLNAGT